MNKSSTPSSDLLSSKDAGAILGYTHDYISRLCRQGKMSGVQKGREWYVTQEELEAFKGRHEIELQEKKKLLSKKFSKIRLEHEAKKRKAKEEALLSQQSSQETKISSIGSSESIQKSIKFKMPSQFVALVVLGLLLFGSTIFDTISKKTVAFQNDSTLGYISTSIDEGIQKTIYAQATAVEPVATAFMSLSYVAEGFTYFTESIAELPSSVYRSLRFTGNAYLTLYVLQGEALYEAGLQMNTMGASVLRGYELIGESFYFGSKDIIRLYIRVLHLDSSAQASQNIVQNFTANVGAGFGYAKETIGDTIFKKATSQIISTFNTWVLNIDSNVSAMQSNITNISQDMGAYVGSIFNFNLVKKDTEIKTIRLQK